MMRFKTARRLTALALAAAMCLLASCMGRENFVQTVFMSADVRGAYVVDPADHRSLYQRETLAAEDGSYRFYFDEKTGSPAVYDARSGVLWSALPTGENRSAAVLTVEAFNGAATYLLNSQDHAVAYGTVSSEKKDGCVLVTFVMSDKESVAQKSPAELTAGDIYISVPVAFSFEGGRLTASVEMDRVVCAPGLVLYNVSLLPFFGALSDGTTEWRPADLPQTTAETQTEAPTELPAEVLTGMPTETTTELPTEASTELLTEAAAETTEPDGTGPAAETTAMPETLPQAVPAAENAGPDFILVPDGCGAAAEPQTLAGGYPELEFCVYGSDDSLGRQACLGAFGVKKGAGAFVCVLTEGEELAAIRTLRQPEESGGGEYVVYPRYTVTPVFNYNGDMAYAVTYEGTLSQTYSFLSGSGADVAGMAAAARETLIYSGMLTAKTLSDGTYPVNITLTGSLDGSKNTLLTDCGQAEALLSQLKAKGVGKVDLVLEGFLTGGTERNPASAASLDPVCGNPASFDSLCDYAVKQGYDLYLGKDLLTAGHTASAARELSGRKKTDTDENPYVGVGEETYAKTRVGWEAIPKNASAFLAAAADAGYAGIALTDLDRGLSADFTARAYDRVSVSGKLADIASSCATVKKLLVSGGNLNVLRYAGAAAGVPYETAVPESEGYRAVPLLEMILHGSYVYASEACVSAEAEKPALLKAVEYGGVPRFGWTGSERGGRGYETYLNAAAEFCARAGKELQGLPGARMTANYQKEPGVKCTEYDNGAKVYVNYNNYSAAIGEIIVPPYDYIRIN